MKTVKILHCADVHIGAAESFLGTAAASRRIETLLTFEKIIDTARDNGVKILLIAGDLFDTNSLEAELINPVFEKIASVNKVKVVFAAGNHDPLSADSPFKNRKLPENLYILKTKDDCITFEELGVRVYGKSFGSVYVKGEERFSLIPPTDDYINIMLIHGETASDMSSNYNAVTPKFITESKMDYIALGHIHKYDGIGKLNNTYFAYSGCPEGQGFDELGEKGVLMGEIGKGTCFLEFLTLCRRMHINKKIDISGLSASSEISEKILSEIEDEFKEGFGENLYKIKLIGEIPEGAVINTTEILNRVATRVYFVKLIDSTEYTVDFEVLSKEISLKGLFVKRMLERMEKAEEGKKAELKYALKLGLKAFSTEVGYDN